jgi:hypothetical protein
VPPPTPSSPPDRQLRRAQQHASQPIPIFDICRSRDGEDFL